MGLMLILILLYYNVTTTFVFHLTNLLSGININWVHFPVENLCGLQQNVLSTAGYCSSHLANSIRDLKSLLKMVLKKGINGVYLCTVYDNTWQLWPVLTVRKLASIPITNISLFKPLCDTYVKILSALFTTA